jgi:hypothetical protein
MSSPIERLTAEVTKLVGKFDEQQKRIALLEAAILEYRAFRWKPDSRGWCLPYGDAEKKLFAVLQEQGDE